MIFNFKNEATEHWWHQRLTAIALVPLSIWLAYNIVDLAGASHSAFTFWLRSPVNAVLMNFTILAAFYHAALGAAEVIVDYVHDKKLKKLSLIGVNLFFLLGGLASIAAVLKIVFTGGA